MKYLLPKDGCNIVWLTTLGYRIWLSEVLASDPRGGYSLGLIAQA
jgi:hypothetical protein